MTCVKSSCDRDVVSMVGFHTGQDGVPQDLPRVREGVPDPGKVVVAPLATPALRGVETRDNSSYLRETKAFNM
jgi:hypothetical protein